MNAGPGARDWSLLVVGEALVDVVHGPDGSVRRLPGGSPANVAVALGRLGRRPRLRTWIADDADGRRVARWLTDSGVVVDDGSWGAAHTTSVRADVDVHGLAHYRLAAAWDFDPGDPEGADVIHVGSTACLIDPGGARLLAALRRIRGGGGVTVTYDPNIRPPFITDPDRARRRVAELVALADVVKVSAEDLAWLEPGIDPQAAARRWSGVGTTAVVVVTMGGDGATVHAAGGPPRHHPAPQTGVVDTVGAGDSFMGALIDGLVAAAEPRGATAVLGRPGPEVLHSVVARAVRAGAISVARPGADPPWRSELDG